MKLLVNLILVILLSGCLSKGDIFNHQPLSSASITTMDARQRAIIANKINSAQSNQIFLRMCAEPFPDIFTIVSSSLAAGVDAEAKSEAGKLASVKASAQIAQALKESGASIDRSQTVNLLSMSLYRTCERYLNGGVTEEELQIQAMRDQRTMISILAIEQLTTIARPQNKPVILNSDNTAASIGGASAKELIEAKSKADDAGKKRDDKKGVLDNAFKGSSDAKKCTFSTDADKLNACDKAQKKFDDAKKLADREEELYQLLKKSTGFIKAETTNLGQDGVIQQSATVEIKINNLDSASITKIADTVLALAKLGVDLNPYETCILSANQQFEQLENGRSSIDPFSELRQAKLACEVHLVKPSYVESTLSVNTPLDPGSGKSSYPINFYVQSSRGCDSCTILVNKANDEAKKLGFNLHSTEYMSSNYMPRENQIRYFYDIDKGKAEQLADKLGIKVLMVNVTNAKPGLIELWVVN